MTAGCLGPGYFNRQDAPKVLLTTCYKPSKLMFELLAELLDVLPVVYYYKRQVGVLRVRLSQSLSLWQRVLHLTFALQLAGLLGEEDCRVCKQPRLHQPHCLEREQEGGEWAPACALAAWTHRAFSALQPEAVEGDQGMLLHAPLAFLT